MLVPRILRMPWMPVAGRNCCPFRASAGGLLPKTNISSVTFMTLAKPSTRISGVQVPIEQTNGGSGGLTGVILRKNGLFVSRLPASVTVRLILAVPKTFLTGVMVTVRLLPVPPRVRFASGIKV